MDGVNITIVRQARQAACGLWRGQAHRDARLATRRAGTTRARLIPRPAQICQRMLSILAVNLPCRRAHRNELGRTVTHS